MSAQKWHELPMIAVDTETTGINPLEARVVTAAVVHLTPGQRPRPIQWVIDPGVDIPDEAAAVHGWTNDRISAHLTEQGGRAGWATRSMVDSTGKTVVTAIPADTALFEIAGQVAAAIGRDAAVIVHNAAYDLTLLEAEFARNNVPQLRARPQGIVGVVDPMVIEKAYDPYRKVNFKDEAGCRGGKTKCAPPCGSTDKKLESLCSHYGIRFGASGAHDAAADAIAAARLARRLMEAWPATARLKLATLHEHQVTWRRDQADGLRVYFDKNDIEHDGVDPGWPTYTTLPKAVAA